MITLHEWLDVVDYRVAQGGVYTGPVDSMNPYYYDAWDDADDSYSHNIVFDRVTLVVFEVTACDYINRRAYRYRNPDYAASLNPDESEDDLKAWDDVKYEDCGDHHVWADYARLVRQTIPGPLVREDGRVETTLDLTDEELFKLMKAAHERDITLNHLVEEILQEALGESQDTSYDSTTLDPNSSPSE